MGEEGCEDAAAPLPRLEIWQEGLLCGPSSVVSVVRGLGDAQARDGAGGRKISDPRLWKERGGEKYNMEMMAEQGDQILPGWFQPPLGQKKPLASAPAPSS